MKYVNLFNFLYLSISIIILCGCEKKISCPDSTKISLGTISEGSVYENSDLNIIFTLPPDFFYFQRGMQEPLNTNDLLQNFDATDSIILKNIKDNSDQGWLFSLENVIIQENVKIESIKKIKFIIKYSKGQNLKKDMKEFRNIYESQGKHVPEKMKFIFTVKETDLPFGKNEKLPAFNINGALTGFKNYGCYNLLISVDFYSETDKTEVFNFLESIELIK